MCGKRIRACPTSLYTHVQPELDGQDGAWASLGESVASITDMVRVPLITRDCCKISSATNSTRMPYDHNATATRDSCSHDMDPTKEPMPVSRSLYCDTQTQQGSRQGKAAGRAAGRAGQQAGQGSRHSSRQGVLRFDWTLQQAHVNAGRSRDSGQLLPVASNVAALC
jgi:hypothetical protein